MTVLTLTITDAGRNAMVNAANTGTLPLALDKVVLGRACYVPMATQLALHDPIKPLATFGGSLVADDTLHITITDDSFDTYSLGEIGLYSGEVLFAVYSQALPIMEKGPEQMVLLSADIQFLSLPANSVTVGSTEFAYPQGNELRPGVLEIATPDEATTGNDHTRAITPLTLKQGLETKLGKLEAAVAAAKWSTARQFVISGDGSGMALMDGSGNVVLQLEVNDNSHGHTIENVSGLATALSNKLAATANAVSASRWAISRLFKISGNANGQVYLDGSGDVELNLRVTSADAATILDGGTIKAKGQDLTIWDKRAMVGNNASNALIINYGSDWGSTLIYGPVFTGQLQSDRMLAVKNGSTTYGDSQIEARSTDGSDARIGFHQSGVAAGAINFTSWGFQFEREAGRGSRANVVGANFFAESAQDLSGNALTRLDYVGANFIAKNTGNVLNNPSFGVGFLSSSDTSSAWIAGYFGKNGGSNQVVIGENGGYAVIGGHSAAKNAWAELMIGVSPGGSGNQITHISMPYARVQGNPTSYEVFHRGMFNPDAESRFVARGDAADCNTAVANGHWRLTPSTANIPSATYGCMFTVSEGWGVGHAGAWLQQTAYMHDGTIWTRRSVNGNWMGWTRLWDSAGFNPDAKLSNNGSGGTLYLSNWFRSTGATGWYNETYGGGLYMDESSTVKVFGGKNFSAPANLSVGNDMVCLYAYANGAQPQVANALTRKDYVDAGDYATRWNNSPVINHSGGDANAHYNSEWDGNLIANAPSANWFFFREIYHSGGSNWRHQEAFDFFSNEEYFRRGLNTSDHDVWCRRWHSGNFDPASKSDTGHGHAAATQAAAGFMSAVDKIRLDNIAKSKSPAEYTLWSGEAGSSTTSISVSQSLANFNAIRWEGYNADRSITWTYTMPCHEWVALCASGLHVNISAGSYYFTFKAQAATTTTMTRHTNSAYLTRIVGIN